MVVSAALKTWYEGYKGAVMLPYVGRQGAGVPGAIMHSTHTAVWMHKHRPASGWVIEDGHQSLRSVPSGPEQP